MESSKDVSGLSDSGGAVDHIWRTGPDTRETCQLSPGFGIRDQKFEFADFRVRIALNWIGRLRHAE